MEYFAHSGHKSDQSDWQRLDDHALCVAQLAAEFASPIGLGRAAYLAGLLHDLGKYTRAFKARLAGADIAVDHSTAGAAHAQELVARTPQEVLMAQLIAYSILGHHAGLPDRLGSSGFDERIERFRSDTQRAIDPIWYEELKPEGSALFPIDFRQVRDHVHFQFAFMTRMIFSCLVDADFKDTEAFYSRIEGLHKNRDWEALPDLLPSLIARFDGHMAGLRGEATAINALRSEILFHVRSKASEAPGLFTLTVPTGGGKTLASLGFALDHARAYGHRRIIYAIPFTSIIDQTAKIFRDVLGGGDDVVLEHHSAIDEEAQRHRTDRTSRDKLKLAMEDWAAPVVVTTNVQLFESLAVDVLSGAARQRRDEGAAAQFRGGPPMSILASLVRAYDRLPDAPAIGYSAEKIGFLISLNTDGTVAHVIDLRTGEGRNRSAATYEVPQSFKRPGVTPRPFFLWDNCNYALGVESIHDPDDARFDTFKRKHLELLSAETDEGLVAFCRFLSAWVPECTGQHVALDELKSQKVVFALESERLAMLLHQRPRAREIWAEHRHNWLAVGDKQASSAVCLVTGQHDAVARTHPPIKGIPSSSGKDADSIVSYNKHAFESYDHEQGDNAQVSEVAAFKYTTTLNRFLSKDSGHRIQIGDASTVFWADTSDPELASEAESLFLQWVNPGDDEAAATKQIADKLTQIRAGKLLRDIEPKLEGVRFYVLGLSPNAARISIRFYFEDSFGVLTQNYQRYLQDMALEPGPKEEHSPLWRYLVELAVLGKRENIPPNLAGEWMRAILAGTRYPMTLLSTVLQRIRSDGEIGAYRVAMLRALLVRNFNLSKEAPVALDTDNTNRGYLLGRLFAIYERIQLAALGDVNASIKDKFYGSASAQPRKVFHMLDSGSANHLSKLGKQSPGYKIVLERTIGAIMDSMQPGTDPFPASLSAEEQALFGLGYYHQRNEFFRKSDNKSAAEGDSK